jgi:hypothetical protein
MEDEQLSAWDDYKREEREPESKITGKQRCVITAVEEKTSKASGLPMIEITVRPSGCRFTVKSWLVHNDNFNRNATQFFDAFPEIGDGNFSFVEWIGAEGAAMFKEDENNYLRIAYWIDPVRAANLPPFEGEKPERQTITTLEAEDGLDDEMPF